MSRRNAAVGSALLATATALVFSVFFASPAAASTLVPCPKPPPSPSYQGEGTLVNSAAFTRTLRGLGVRQQLISPANRFTGRPTFPLTTAGISETVSTVALGGGLRLSAVGGKRQVAVRSMKLVIRPGRKAIVNARVAGRSMRLFTVSGGTRSLNSKDGLLNLRGGLAKLSGPASRQINSVLGLRAADSIASGRQWGKLTVFAARNNKVDDPVAEVPVEPPFLERPVGAAEITSATIKWRVRESFIRYVAVGDGTSVADGALADPPEVVEGAAPLVYAFNFPFSDGWVASEPGPAAIHGSGKVGFRHCQNTINFTVSEPEIELNGDSDSRLIFRVDGTDGTAFPDSRAVMVQLIPSLATKTVDGDTTTLSGIPGYIPQAATGIFADFYPPFPGSVDGPGADLSRFGSVTVTYTSG